MNSDVSQTLFGSTLITTYGNEPLDCSEFRVRQFVSILSGKIEEVTNGAPYGGVVKKDGIAEANLPSNATTMICESEEALVKLLATQTVLTPTEVEGILSLFADGIIHSEFRKFVDYLERLNAGGRTFHVDGRQVSLTGIQSSGMTAKNIDFQMGEKITAHEKLLKKTQDALEKNSGFQDWIRSQPTNTSCVITPIGIYTTEGVLLLRINKNHEEFEVEHFVMGGESIYRIIKKSKPMQYYISNKQGKRCYFSPRRGNRTEVEDMWEREDGTIFMAAGNGRNDFDGISQIERNTGNVISLGNPLIFQYGKGKVLGTIGF